MRQVLSAGALEDQEGWDGEGGGRGDQDVKGGTHVNSWLIHANVWQKPLQYCKVISLQLIKINGKKRKKVLLSFGANGLKEILYPECFDGRFNRVE